MNLKIGVSNGSSIYKIRNIFHNDNSNDSKNRQSRAKGHSRKYICLSSLSGYYIYQNKLKGGNNENFLCKNKNWKKME